MYVVITLCLSLLYTRARRDHERTVWWQQLISTCALSVRLTFPRAVLELLHLKVFSVYTAPFEK
jgi:hypothetical protein